MSRPEVREVLTAADRARAGWDKSAAPKLYSQAIELVGEDEHDGRRIRLLRGLALVEAGDLEAGAVELSELLQKLEGRDEVDALLGLGRASMWMEQTDQARSLAERALRLAESLGEREMRGPAIALLSQTTGMRGLEGDLASAVELGDRALRVWVEGTRSVDLALHFSLHALNHYWVGSYAVAAELGGRARQLGEEVSNAQAHLEGGATEGLALAALGRHQQAIELFDLMIARARELDVKAPTAYALACSTAALRDLLDLDEARRRSQETIELFSQVGFESGVMQGEMDLLFTDLLGDGLARAERAWPGLWERARQGSGWERWIAPGRLSVARAEIALRTEGAERAIQESLQAIERARSIGRKKYEAAARITLGTALLELGRNEEATTELRAAVKAADELGHPPMRWQARAALGRALYDSADDEGAATASLHAANIIRGFVANLKPELTEHLLASQQVQELLQAG